MRVAGAAALIGLLCLAIAPVAGAAGLSVKSAVIRIAEPRLVTISRLDEPPKDEGLAGARVATDDNTTTGRFLGHDYETVELDVTPDGALAGLDRLAASGVRFVVAVGAPEAVLALADHAAGRDILLFNAAARDDRLRGADCRANLFHTAPSRAMIADGVAQYLVWKRWTNWLLVHGSHEPDRLMAAAYRRAATKFGARIVEERVFEDTGGARRSDSGHVLVQRQIPVFMQEARAHDVVIAADESQVFGVYLPYRTWDARPVAGDAGLEATSWHPAQESFGGTQLQRRFERKAGRAMRDVDYQVWMALRAVGEAVTRTGSAEVAAVRDHLRGDAFALAAFSGQPLSFRPWDNQLRMGVILGDRRNVVTISPQEEFLHQRTRLDTLGMDEPETDCRF